MKKISVLFVCILVLLSLDNAFGEPKKNLFIMGWDGAGLNNVRPLLENGTLVSLKRFINREGGKLCPLETLSKTNTVTGWTQYFTGLTYDQSGTIGNDRYGLRGFLTPEEIIDSRSPDSGSTESLISG